MIQARLLRFASASLLALGIAFAASPAQAQTVEVEPNSTCLSAQPLGALPATVAGSLDTPPATPDVDYYRVTATPGEMIQIEHRGSASGNGTLYDPFLGVFNSSCGYLAYNDDGFGDLDSRVEVRVPADGVVVIAATSTWDWEFSGSGNWAGSYELTVRKLAVAQGLGGRVVNAVTGAAVENAVVWLNVCDPSSECWQYAGYAFTGPDGTFRFEPGNFTLYDDVLRAGEYRLIVDAGDAFVVHEGGRFQLLEGQDLNVGDVDVQPVPVIGSVRGRLVDAVTGEALSGTAAPFSWVALQTCPPENGGWCWSIRNGTADAQGNFVFESTQANPIPPGVYNVIGRAEQYEATVSANFEVAADQHYDLGDFQVKSFPVRINLTSSCTSIPSTGGDCPYVVRITNGNPSKLLGETWSLVQSIPSYWGGGQSTQFQAGRKTVSLLPGSSTDVSFTFNVPASLQDGTAICARAFTSHKTNPFDSIGVRDLFCIAKVGTAFKVMPDKDKRELLKKAKVQ